MQIVTKKFCELAESNSVRTAIQKVVKENRFYGYATTLKSNPTIAELAKDNKEKELAFYLKKNNGNLNIPVKLTDTGIRRMANALVLMFKEG